MPIQNYGLHWNWQYGMRGKANARGPVVNFSGIQVGIYVLYAGDIPMYIGRSGDGRQPSISGRLVDHEQTKPGWDNYCWFGFLPVVNGVVERRTTLNIPISVAISDIEAFAIYVLKGIVKNDAPGKHRHMEQYFQQPSDA
jgi:hypothetical protein